MTHVNSGCLCILLNLLRSHFLPMSLLLGKFSEHSWRQKHSKDEIYRSQQDDCCWEKRCVFSTDMHRTKKLSPNVLIHRYVLTIIISRSVLSVIFWVIITPVLLSRGGEMCQHHFVQISFLSLSSSASLTVWAGPRSVQNVTGCWATVLINLSPVESTEHFPSCLAYCTGTGG